MPQTQPQDRRGKSSRNHSSRNILDHAGPNFHNDHSHGTATPMNANAIPYIPPATTFGYRRQPRLTSSTAPAPALPQLQTQNLAHQINHIPRLPLGQPQPYQTAPLHIERAYLLQSLQTQDFHATAILKTITEHEQLLLLPDLTSAEQRRVRKKLGWQKERLGQAIRQEQWILGRLGQVAWEIQWEERRGVVQGLVGGGAGGFGFGRGCGNGNGNVNRNWSLGAGEQYHWQLTTVQRLGNGWEGQQGWNAVQGNGWHGQNFVFDGPAQEQQQTRYGYFGTQGLGFSFNQSLPVSATNTTTLLTLPLTPEESLSGLTRSSSLNDLNTMNDADGCEMRTPKAKGNRMSLPDLPIFSPVIWKKENNNDNNLEKEKDSSYIGYEVAPK